MWKQRSMRQRLDEYVRENERLRKRRERRARESGAKERPAAPMNRADRRLRSSGAPRSVLFSQKMKVPKGRR